MMKNLFFDRLINAVPKNIFSVGFPESFDSRILEASTFLLKHGLVRSVHFFSQENTTLALANRCGILIEPYLKKISWNSYEDHCLHAANKLLQKKILHVVIAGCHYSTADVIRSGLKIIGLNFDSEYLSGSFLLYRNIKKPECVLIADSAVIVEPTSEQLVSIAKESVKTWRKINFDPSIMEKEPRVAFLSFSTDQSAEHSKVELVRKAFFLFKKQCPEVLCDGELQFDAAVDKKVLLKKKPDSVFKNSKQPNILIFPDLNSGNIGYKMPQKWGGFSVCGPLLQGLSRPLGDLSRGASVQDIVATTCLHLLQSMV